MTQQQPTPRIEGPVSGPMFVPPPRLANDPMFKTLARTKATLSIGINEGVPSYQIQFQGKLKQDDVFKIAVYYSQILTTYLEGLVTDTQAEEYEEVDDLAPAVDENNVIKLPERPKLWLPGT